MLLFYNQGRNKTDHVFAGTDDNKSFLKRLVYNLSRRFFYPDSLNQSGSPYLLYLIRSFLQRLSAFTQIFPHFLYMCGNAFSFKNFYGLRHCCAYKGIAAVGGTVVARLQ